MRNAILTGFLGCVVWLGAPGLLPAQETSGPTPPPAAKPSSATAPDPATSSGPPPHIAYLDKEKTIYVMDFAPAPEQAAKPAAPGVSSSDGPIDSGSMKAPRLNASEADTPASAAGSGPSRILADDLMRGLKKAGYKTKFLTVDEAAPEEGLLLTGVFTRTGPDNVLRRVTVGPGQPATDVQLYITTENLLRTERPLYEPVGKTTEKDPAGEAIRLNPEVATLKFSIQGNPDAKAVKKLADQIVAELQRLTLQAEAQGLSGSGDPINKYSKP
jgi:hypothetical protein